MINPAELWQGFQQYLDVDSEVLQKEGDRINVGEMFVLRIVVSNSAPHPNPGDARNRDRDFSSISVGKKEFEIPKIVFLDPIVGVHETRYAKPRVRSGSLRYAEYSLSPRLLGPGGSSYVDVEMEAVDEIRGWRDRFQREKVGVLQVMARVDFDAFARVKIKSSLRTEINPS